MTIATAVPVEATSLSSVSRIATNPPLHLSEPIQLPRIPLVLYIARVPGSRDVFLTPLKPRDRVVTAQDVQSSLYYVHVNSQGDYEADIALISADSDAVAPPVVPNRTIQEAPPLPRRPLTAPSVPPYPTEDFLVSSLQVPPSSVPSKHRIARKPIVTTKPKTDDPAFLPPVLPPRPRPLPAIPDDEQPCTSPLHEEGLHSLQGASYANGSDSNTHHLNAPPSRVSHAEPFDCPAPGSLTLIRRDPSSSEQWNVAHIHDPPVYEVSSAALLNSSTARRTKNSGAPLYVDITNPSYEQFLERDRSRLRMSTSTVASSDSDPASEGIFRRRLYMPGSKFRQHGYGHNRRFGSVDSNANADDTFMRKTMRRSVDMSMKSESSSPAFADRRSTGYNFTSPWDSYCEFATTATGKSLKCRHYLPDRQSHERSVTVSELRFNLPVTSSSSATDTAHAEKRSSYFQGMHRRLGSTDSANEPEPRTPTFILDEDGRIDLSLGQEKAGGGFGGRQAKLGKLIIEPEGMKMLDLLVAANVGLWWRAYGRV